MTLPILPPKPKYGAPCNGCGLCCAAQLCEIGKMAFGEDGPLPCPALKMSLDGSRTVCAFVMTEEAAGMPPMIRESLGIGLGCSMEDGDG